MANKIALSFNDRAYKRAEKAHAEFKNSKEQLITLIDSYGVDGKSLIKASSIYKETAEAIFTKLAEGSNLPEGINKIKFLDLMNVDLVPLSKGVNSYNALLKFADKPKKETFTTYLDSSNEDDYNELKDAILILNKLARKGYIADKRAIANGFGNKVGVDMYTTEFKFNSLKR